MFYIQLVDEQDKVDAIQGSLESFFENEDPAPLTNIHVGLPCAARYSEDGMWYRAEITSVIDDQVSLFFVDFGNTDVLKLSDIKGLPTALVQMSTCAIPCTLKPGAEFSDETCVAFTIATAEKELDVEVLSQTKPYRVRIKDGNDDFTRFLTEGDDEIQNSSTDDVDIIKSAESAPRLTGFIDYSVPDEAKGYICNGHSPAMFSVQLVDEVENLAANQAVLAEYYNEESSCEKLKEVHVGSVCAAKFSEDEIWYRAEVTSIKGDNASLHFVDYGNSEVQAVPGLMVLPESQKTIPKFAISCCIERRTDYSDEDLENFASIAEEEDLKFIFKSKLVPHNVEIWSEEENLSIAFLDKVADDEEDDIVLSNRDDSTYGAFEVDVGQKMECYVTNVESINQVYIQPAKYDDELDELNQKIDSYVPDLPQLTNAELSKPCLALFAAEYWYRALILDITDDGYVVQFVDYGNSCEVKPDEVKAIHPPFMALPRLAFQASLYGIESNDENAVPIINEITNEKKLSCEVVTVENGIPSIKLLDMGMSIGQTIVERGVASAAAISEQPSILETSADQEVLYDIEEQLLAELELEEPRLSYKCHEISIGDKLDVYVTSAVNINEFWCQISDSCDSLPQLIDSIQEYCESASEDKVVSECKIGLPCLTKFSKDDLWYRSKILEIDDDEALVLFVDYGNKERVSVKNTLQITSDYVTLPAQVFMCKLFDVEPLSSDKEMSRNRFNEIVHEKELKFVVKEKDITGLLSGLLYCGDESISSILLNEEAVQCLQKGSNDDDLNTTESKTEDIAKEFQKEQVNKECQEESGNYIDVNETIDDKIAAEDSDTNQTECANESNERFIEADNEVKEVELKEPENEVELKEPENEVELKEPENEIELKEPENEVEIEFKKPENEIELSEPDGEVDKPPKIDLIPCEEEALRNRDEVHPPVLDAQDQKEKIEDQESSLSNDKDDLKSDKTAETDVSGIEDSEDEGTAESNGATCGTAPVDNALEGGSDADVAVELATRTVAKDAQAELSSHDINADQENTSTEEKTDSGEAEECNADNEDEVSKIETSDITEGNLKYKSLPVKLSDKIAVSVLPGGTPDWFWCQPKEFEVDFQKMVDNLQESCETLDPSDSEFDIGAVCCAKDVETKKWCRVVVEAIEDDIYNVSSVDYGQEMIVVNGELRELPNQYLELPMMAFPCHLSGIQAKEWSNEEITQFCDLASSAVEIEITDEDGDTGTFGVNLLLGSSEENDSVNASLIKMGIGVAKNKENDVGSEA